jgi:hypothetical protein
MDPEDADFANVLEWNALRVDGVARGEYLRTHKVQSPITDCDEEGLFLIGDEREVGDAGLAWLQIYCKWHWGG